MRIWQRILIILAGEVRVDYGKDKFAPMKVEKLVQLGAQAHIKTLQKRERRRSKP